MAQYFRMPMLGNTMEEGTILQWFKQEGDPVKAGEPLLEVMSDKANFEVEAPADGVLRKVLAEANGTVPVNEPIAIIGTADEPLDGLCGGEPAPPTATAPSAVPEKTPAGPVAGPAAATPEGRINISPRARRMADERGVPIAALSGLGTGPQGRILERDVVAYVERTAALVGSVVEDAPKSRTTPLAARIAEDLGIDVAGLALGLPGSRVTADVVRRHAEGPVPAPAPAAAAPGELAVSKVIPFRGMRKMVADNVARSRQTAPHVTLVVEVDMTEAAALQARLVPEIQKAYNTKPTYTDLLVKATAKALKDHPFCNASLVGDEIRLYSDLNVGVAVATDNGLIVPVIKHADAKSLGEVSIELKALVERCRTGKQTQDDLSGGTFTITNLGQFGIDQFDPILVPPQACILGVCRIAQKPAVVDGEIRPRPMMNLCLSFDHRVLDGVPAARFLQRLKELLQNPLLIFI